MSAWPCQTSLLCLFPLAPYRLSHTSRRPSHIAEMFITSLLIPPLAIYWRIRGAIKYRVFFL
ncbi:MAG TPA: hypothetical protein VGN15_13110 [Ktedonobacteraceae bacterium]|nr:hypothetical protein [Ktedonobacteraceae bacterium]